MSVKRKKSTPAARCPLCRKKVSVTASGRLRKHGYNPYTGKPPCPGGITAQIPPT